MRGQVVALDELHDQGMAFNPVDRGDVRMIERREDLRFTGKARESLRVRSEELGQDFDCHVAIELGVARAIHLAHAAGAEDGEDCVGAETSA